MRTRARRPMPAGFSIRPPSSWRRAPTSSVAPDQIDRRSVTFESRLHQLAEDTVGEEDPLRGELHRRPSSWRIPCAERSITPARKRSRSKPVAAEIVAPDAGLGAPQHQHGGLAHVLRVSALRAGRSHSARPRPPVRGQVAGVGRSNAAEVRAAHSEAEVGVIRPVDQVVPRFLAGPGEIGDLVHRQARALRALDRGSYIRSTSSPSGCTRPLCLRPRAACPSRRPVRSTRDATGRAKGPFSRSSRHSSSSSRARRKSGPATSGEPRTKQGPDPNEAR